MRPNKKDFVFTPLKSFTAERHRSWLFVGWRGPDNVLYHIGSLHKGVGGFICFAYNENLSRPKQLGFEPFSDFPDVWRTSKNPYKETEMFSFFHKWGKNFNEVAINGRKNIDRIELY